MKIKRSDIAECVRESVGVPDEIEIKADTIFEQAKNPHATVFGEMNDAIQAVLRNAPRHCRQRYCFDGAWILDPEDEMTPFYAYRLNPVCKLVEDSQWVEYPVKATTIDSIDEYIVTGMPRSPFLWSICGYVGHVCVKVRDAKGREYYTPSWSGPYSWFAMYPTIENLIGDSNQVYEDVDFPITPIAVVFEANNG